jgi:hypothetical protein
VLEGILVGIIDASLLRQAMQSCSGVDTLLDLDRPAVDHPYMPTGQLKPHGFITLSTLGFVDRVRVQLADEIRDKSFLWSMLFFITGDPATNFSSPLPSAAKDRGSFRPRSEGGPAARAKNRRLWHVGAPGVHRRRGVSVRPALRSVGIAGDPTKLQAVHFKLS